MTQAAVDLTAEQLAKLAEIAGLELECLSLVGWSYTKGNDIICLQGAFRPDQAGGYLGMVIDGMAALGFRIEIIPGWYGVEGEEGMSYMVSFLSDVARAKVPRVGCVQDVMQSQLPLAICRAALLAAKERVSR